MKKRVVFGVSLICLLSLGATLWAQDKKPAADKKAAAGHSPEEMAAMMAAAAPGPHHKMLQEGVGTWDTKSTWMMPGAAPTTDTGMSTIESALGGRFIVESAKGTMMGMPWEGRGVFGYDNVTQKHVGTWSDVWGTGIMYMEGTCDGTCRTMTMTGSYVDPATKAPKKMKVVHKEPDADNATLELYDVAKDGKETKMGEIKYTRKKV